MNRYIIIIILIALVFFCSVTIINKQDEPKQITLIEFNKRVGEKNKTVLVYCHADWCSVCIRMKSTMSRIDSIYKGRLEILEIDTDRDKEITEEFEINSLPVLILYKNGVREWDWIGVIGEKDLKDKLNVYIAQ